MLRCTWLKRGLSTKAWRDSYSIELARKYLAQFVGGNISLTKNEADGIGMVTIENHGKKNAFTGNMMVQLEQIVCELEDWKKGRLVIINGADGNFCSGGDLSFVKQIANANDGFMMNMFMSKTLERIRSLPVVSIANVQGFALGGGAEVLTACDIRACHKGAKIGFVQGKMAVTPGWGGTSRLLEILGRSKAIETLSSAKVMTASHAQSIGFVNYVYDNDTEFDNFIESFTKIPVATTRALKTCVNNVMGASSIEEKYSSERAIFTTTWGGHENINILNSNLKHR